MTEQWQELKETITELRDNDGTATQQEVCKFLANLMDVLEKQMSSSEKPNKWIPVSERLPEKPDGYPYCGIYRIYFLVSLESGCVETLAYEFERDEWQITGSPVKAWMPLPLPYKASPTGAESEDKE